MGSRVVLNPRPARRSQPALVAAMLGHCPGRVRLERLRGRGDLLAEVRQLGYQEAVSYLEADEAGVPDTPEAKRIRGLYHLPLPFLSLAEFDDVFPDASEMSTGYRSTLAGDGAWLPQAVEDYFANGGQKLWVVRVPEDEGQAGFLPRAGSIYETATLRGMAATLVIPELGLLALPDLERLRVPANLPDIARVRLENPQPQFLPCTTDLSDDHRERRHGSEVEATSEEVLSLEALLEAIMRLLQRYRPDVQCLFTLPLSYSAAAGSPVVDPRALAVIEALKGKPLGPGLRRIQLLFPYLRSPRRRLVSAVGLIAGLQTAVAQRQGVWRSVAGLPVLTDGQPYPVVSTVDAAALRKEPGIGVFVYRNGRVMLDDEQLAMPALPAEDYPRQQADTRFDGYRSGEVQRFLGFLIRGLRELGELLVFDVAFGDPRPRLLLEEFFRSLHSQGALRGRLAEQAFFIRERAAPEGVISYEIEVAPAYPIDRLRLTFTNRTGDWQAEVARV